MIKYFKNFILCNDIDFYCLLCNEPFVSTADVEKHIRWEKHRKLIKTQCCLPKFSKDAIFKIQDQLYYCEICNYITTTLSAVKKHTTEEGHQTNKTDPEKVKKPVIAEKKLGFISLSNVFLQRYEWHGVVEKFCVHCDTTIDAFDIHAALPCHMLNFMQSELVKLGKDDSKKDVCYRKLKDGNKYFCFKCRQTFLADQLETHWTEVHTFNENTKRPKMLFNIDAMNDLGICTLCHKTCNGFMQISDHRKEHINKKEWEYNELEGELTFIELTFRDKGKVRNALKSYGKENYIKLNEGGSKGYCNLCHTHISAHIRNFKQHVGGMHHQGQLELRGLIKKTKKSEKPKYKSKPLKQYMTDCIHLKNSNLFLIPDAEVCVDVVSFAMISKLDFKKGKDEFVCFVCDEVFSDISKHLKGEHKEKMFKTTVVTSVKDEFIREPRPGLYHCGVCNMVFAGWPSLERHLSLFKHRFARLEAHRMIEDYVDGNCLEAAMFDLPFSAMRSNGFCNADDFLD